MVTLRLGLSPSTTVLDVTNSGTIFGLILPAGTLTNAAGGLIIDVAPEGAVTIINAGTISYERSYQPINRTRVVAAVGAYWTNRLPLRLAVAAEQFDQSGRRPNPGVRNGGQPIRRRIRPRQWLGRKSVHRSVDNAGSILGNGIGVKLKTGTVVNSGLISLTGTGVEIGNGTLFNSGRTGTPRWAASTRKAATSCLAGVTSNGYGGIAAYFGKGVIVNSGSVVGSVPGAAKERRSGQGTLSLRVSPLRSGARATPVRLTWLQTSSSGLSSGA